MLVLRRVNLSNSNSNIIAIEIFKTGLIVIVIIIIFVFQKIIVIVIIIRFQSYYVSLSGLNGVWLVGMVKQMRAFKFGFGSGPKARRNQASNGVFFLLTLSFTPYQTFIFLEILFKIRNQHKILRKKVDKKIYFLS